MEVGSIAGRRPNKTKTEADAKAAGKGFPHHEGQSKGGQEKIECISPVTKMKEDINWRTRQHDIKSKARKRKMRPFLTLTYSMIEI